MRRFTPPPEPWLAGHRGIDLAAPATTPVLAPGPGTIRFAGPVAGKGVITIDHPDGLRTTYLPVTPSVRRGQPITSGAKIGVLEASKPHCEESCLHWGLIRAARYLNPLQLLGHSPTRLLPFWPPTTANEDSAPNPLRPRNLPPLNAPFPEPSPETHKPTAADLNSSETSTTSRWTTAPAITNPLTTATQKSTTPTFNPDPHDGPAILTAITLRRHHHPRLTLQSLMRAASAPLTSTPFIAIGALLGTLLLLISLSRRRRTRMTQRRPARGQHRKRRRHRSKARKRRRPASPAPPR